MRVVYACLVALILAAPACGSGSTRGLTKIKIPDPGVELSYRLTPGTALTGHLRLGMTRGIEGLEKPLSQSIECDVALVVAPKAEVGTVRLGATFANVDLAWGLPPASSFASDEFRDHALATLREFRGWIEIDARGRVVAVSTPPERTEPELAELLEALLDTVAASFVPTPTTAVGPGEAWEDAVSAGVASVRMRSTLEGLFRHKERKESVALLTIAYEEDREAAPRAGKETRGRRGDARVLYATDGGYVAELDRELSTFTPSRGMTYEKLRVQWHVARGLPPPPPAEAIEDVQVIGDPCNPDYVGPKRCARAEPAPAPDAETDPESDTESEPESEPGSEPESETESDPTPAPE